MSERQQREPAEPRLVFSDPKGRRRSILGLCLLAVLFVLAVFGSDFVARVERLNAPISVISDVLEVPDERRPNRELTSRVLVQAQDPDCEAIAETIRPVSAFVPLADATALSGLRRRCSVLSEVFYGSAVFGRGISESGETFGAFPAWEFRTVDDAQLGPDRWPFLSPEVGMSDAEVVDLMGGDFDATIRYALPEPESARATGVSGVCLDLSGFGSLPPSLVGTALRALRRHLDEAGLGVCVVGPADAEFLREPDVLVEVGIAVAVLANPEASQNSAPSPPAWVARQIEDLTATVGPQTLRFAVSSAGMSWEGGHRGSSLVSYSVAMEQAAANGADPVYDPGAGSLAIRFIDAERRPNHIWLPDAVTLSQVLGKIPPGYPVVAWPIGYEDSTIWPIFEGTETKPSGTVFVGDQVIEVGTGGLAVLTRAGQTGRRKYEALSDGESGLSSLAYETLPRAAQLEAIGQTTFPALVLTFDGLGRADEFNAVLTALSDVGVRATFFVGLENALFRSDRVSRLLEEGHEVGLLTAAEPGEAGLSGRIDRLGLDLSQHALLHHAGILPALIRHASPSPVAVNSVADVKAVSELQDRGRLEIPPGLSAPYGPYEPEIFHEVVLREVLSRPLNILRFDFSEGNSEAVAERLGATLELLLAEGVEIMALPDVLAEGKPALHMTLDAEPDLLDRIVYGSVRYSWASFKDFFLILALLVLLRAPIQIVLALIWKNRFPFDPTYVPEVTIVVPAYNEERVIERTIRSILESTYRNLKVMVVDDGSGDRTAEIVGELFSHDARVELIQETNHGKWYAEDVAINHLDSPIFVVIDADTLLDSEAIGYLVQPFSDPRVGAVAGTVEVGNHVNFLTRCQSVEYIVSQALMRRAYQAFNGILVVPGAIGAWRTEAVRKAGLVTGDTITEDADLTVAVHRANYKVVYQPDARSYTEVPETLREFMKQRLRWSLGLLQVSWKHKSAIIEGRGVGLVSIVESFWYRLVSGVVYPLLDLLLLGLLIQSAFAVVTGGEPAVLGLSAEFYLAIAALVLLDFVNLTVAFAFDRRWDWSLLLIPPLMRFGYIQLLYVSSFRALFHAVSGKLDVWDKIFRTGTARLPRGSLSTEPSKKTLH